MPELTPQQVIRRTLYAATLADRDVEYAAEAVLAALAEHGLIVVDRELLDDLADRDPCWFDHHGGCQAHGYLSLEAGERCPHARARELLDHTDDKETSDG